MSDNEMPDPIPEDETPDMIPRDQAPNPQNRRRTIIYILIGIVAALLLVDAVLLFIKSQPSPTPVAGVPPVTATNPANNPSANAVLTPSPTAPAGWTVHQKPGFQLLLPDTWQEVQLDDATLKQEIDNASKDNPHLADQLSGILASGQNKNFLLYGVDAQSKGNVVSNVSVARTSIPSGISAPQAGQEFATALPQLLKGAKVVTTNAPVAIGGTQAAEVDYDLPLVNSAGQLVTVRGIQFIILPKTGDAFVLTVSGDAAQADQWAPLARQIAQSFQIR